MIPRRFPTLRLPLFALLALAGCGDDEGAGGGGGDGATSTSVTATATTVVVSSASTGNTAEPTVVRTSAPDRTHFALELDRAAEAASTDPSSYVVSSDRGDLVVLAVDVMPGRIVLQTEKQKLGVTYQVEVVAGAGIAPGTTSCIAADTATFWADDFGAPNFEQYELIARRVGVGEHVVLYLEEGMEEDAADIAATVTMFDDLIFPIETAELFPAPDRDDNGKILLLGLDGQNYYGGYFTPLNAFTEEQAQQFGAHSNEMEMLFINTRFGWAPREVVTHELSHLLYQEAHPNDPSDNSYHNEGLAECATHLVHGSNDYASSYYFGDFGGDLRGGKSLVQWEYSNYSQYAQAYVYWTYVASRLGGTSGYSELFAVNGAPADVDAFLVERLGAGITDLQLDWLAAMRADAPTGKYGFEGMLNPMPPASLGGGAPVDLAPFAAVYFEQANDGVTPVGPGEHLRFVGIAPGGAVDVSAPFDVAGGAIAALNTRFDPVSATPESTGVVGTGGAAQPFVVANVERLRMHPPPLDRRNLTNVRRWRDAVRAGNGAF